MTIDQRQAASAKVTDLIALLRSHPEPGASPVIEECEALARAIGAFHMEGIRFRMFNVDRHISRAGASLPSGAAALLEDTRRHLEAAGFHTRSHRAPG